MRAYAFVSEHALVRARVKQRSLYLGQQTQIAEQLAARLEISKCNAQRIVRIALDLLGFGDCDRSVNEGKSPGPRSARGTFVRAVRS
jgi:hypothetical protein